MKKIKYPVLQTIFENGEAITIQKELPYSMANEEFAKTEAYKGEYVIEDDGLPTAKETPTQLDAIEAQVTYTAMMTDTLLEV